MIIAVPASSDGMSGHGLLSSMTPVNHQDATVAKFAQSKVCARLAAVDSERRAGALRVTERQRPAPLPAGVTAALDRVHALSEPGREQPDRAEDADRTAWMALA